MSTARRAKESDVEQIVQLSLAVQKLHSNRYPDLFKEVVNTDELSDFYRTLMGDHDNYIFVTELGESITGYCWGELIRTIESPITHSIRKLYIHQICVDERYRGKGLGKVLVRETVNLANSLDVNHVGADSWSFNSRAVDFFRSQGFNSHNERMWLK
jgi:ribosomal protein S18 acetylase RimI-like enzyme